MMHDYGLLGGTGTFVWGLLCLLWVALGSFIFAIIFWLTHNWIVPHKKR